MKSRHSINGSTCAAWLRTDVYCDLTEKSVYWDGVRFPYLNSRLHLLETGQKEKETEYYRFQTMSSRNWSNGRQLLTSRKVTSLARVISPMDRTSSTGSGRSSSERVKCWHQNRLSTPFDTQARSGSLRRPDHSRLFKLLWGTATSRYHSPTYADSRSSRLLSLNFLNSECTEKLKTDISIDSRLTPLALGIHFHLKSPLDLSVYNHRTLCPNLKWKHKQY